jgi:DNA replication protein DnaC
MKGFNDLMKKSPLDFMKNIIRKKYPKLADQDFEIKQVMVDCPGCGEGNIPQYQIKRKQDSDFKDVPLGSGESICVKCEDKRLANEAVTAHKRLKAEKEMSQFWIIPPELEKETLATYKPEDAAQAEVFQTAVNYLKDFKGGDQYNILFRGSYGGGKSHLLKGIAEGIKKMTKTDQDGDEVPMTVGFLTLDNLLDIIKGTFGRREGQTEHDILKAVIKLDFLVIDDLGTESGEWAGKKLFEIVNSRLGKATAYSSNYMDLNGPNGLESRYPDNGGKIVSRLRSNTKIVDLITEDMRNKKQRG